MVIRNSGPKERNKTKLEQTRTSIKIRGSIKCPGGVRILRCHNRRVDFVVIGKTVESIDDSVINNNLTIRMKNDLYYVQGYLRLTFV